MASPQLLDVKSDVDYIALRRRMSRLRVQNSQSTGDDDDDDDLSDEMLRDLIKYWKKNNTDIAKRFIQTRKEKKAKQKAANLVPGTSGRRKSVEFEDLDMTKTGLRLKTHEPLFSNKSLAQVAEAPDCIGSDETLSVRRPKKSVRQQKMDMIINRVSTKSVMSKAEEQIIKSKLDSVSKSPRTIHRATTSSDFRPRTDSGSLKDFRKRLDSDGFRQRSQSGSSKDMRKRTETNTLHQRSGSSKSPPENRRQRSIKSPAPTSESNKSHQRLSSSKSPPENRKQRSIKSPATSSESNKSHQRLSSSKSPPANRRQRPLKNPASTPVIT